IRLVCTLCVYSANSRDFLVPDITPAHILTAFASFEKDIKSAQSEGEAAHQAAIAKFSPEAKEADAKLTAIANDKSKTNAQKGQEIDAILKGLPAGVRKEIEDAMKG
ncbi:unnamed protein product, partial [Cylicostephanus goldi]